MGSKMRYVFIVEKNGKQLAYWTFTIVDWMDLEAQLAFAMSRVRQEHPDETFAALSVRFVPWEPGIGPFGG